MSLKVNRRPHWLGTVLKRVQDTPAAMVNYRKVQGIWGNTQVYLFLPSNSNARSAGKDLDKTPFFAETAARIQMK